MLYNKILSWLLIAFGFFCIAAGFFCASEIAWEIYGHGTPAGYLLVLVGPVIIYLGVKELRSEN